MIQILYVAFHEPLSEEAWRSCLAGVPSAIRNKINRYVRWQDRHAGLFGKRLLLEGLKERGYSSCCLKTLFQNEFGRPFLNADVDFNISHSGEYVVCAISDEARVGVDVEAVRPIDLANFRDYATEEEWRGITKAPDPHESFFDYWTIKESVIKADGKGLSTPLSDVVIRDKKVLLKDAPWFITELDLDPHYKCHLATNLEHCEIRVRKLSDQVLCG